MPEESRPFIPHGSGSLAKKPDDESANFVIELSHPKSLLFLRIACVLEAIALILLTAAFVIALQKGHSESVSDLQCARQVSAYSPLLEEPDLVRYSEYDLPLYFNEKTDYRGPPTPEREILWEKLGPQIIALRFSRQTLCTSDVTPILIELDPKAPFGERADFRSNHKCRNFWDIRQWVIDHTAIP
ncbi:hypothetical protein KXX13_001021 [Aspergillus fumigatus]|nr:hypothetical protein CNMCM8714_003031 [Aspergillus fumigatus]KAH1301491.1 hypothetical protein KXX11_003900 [Aspergillus fumigatus]KAH1455191.1 hypothetical protein KXX13_001021 [Aspergillus fumigatus]KAH1510785.1 hypothetical protein KXX29_004288 [Aspergillus fumigatus]KAH1563120.1 hypothetical protein KXX17_004240 [Aspergillus fumigatus]